MKYKFRNHNSRLATLMISYGAGNRVEFGTDFPCGMAHFMEHMRFKGSKDRSSKDLLKFVAYNGGEMNAWTSEDTVGYHITIPEENIECAFEALRDITQPLFNQEEMIKECEVVCQELRALDEEIDDNVYQKIMQKAFSNGLQYPLIGYEKDVRRITVDDLKKFDRSFYSSDNMLVTLVSSKNHTDLVIKYFGIADGRLLFNPALDDVKYGDDGTIVVEKEGTAQSVVTVSFGSNDVHKMIRRDRAACNVFNNYFGANDDSKLFMRLREDLGLVYDVESAWEDMLDGTLFTITAETDPSNEDKLVKELLHEISKAAVSKPTSEELQRAKNRIKSSIYGILDTSLGTAESMVDEEFHGIYLNDDYVREIESVTLDEVYNVAKTVFSSNRYIGIGKGETCNDKNL